MILIKYCKSKKFHQKMMMTLFVGILSTIVTACGSKTDNKAENEVSNTLNDETYEELITTTEENSEDVLTEGEVLLENDYCKITFNGFEIRENGDFRMKVTEENKTDKKVYICFSDSSVNGIMGELVEETHLEANQTEELNLLLEYGMFLEEYGINTDEISIIEFMIKVKDENSGEYIHEEKHSLYPKGEQNAKKQLYEQSDDDVVLLDNDLCKVIYLGDEISDSKYMINLYIENKTDMNIRYAFESSYINDIKTKITHSYPDVTPGNGIYYSPSWWSLDKNDIAMEDIEKIEMHFAGYSWDNFAKDIIDEVITVYP